MIDKLEKEFEKIYKELDEANFKEVSKGRWPVALGAGAITYVTGESYYGFLLGQWTAFRYALTLIDRVRWEEKDKKKHKTTAFIFRSEGDEL